MDLKELSQNSSNARHPWEVARAQFFDRQIQRISSPDGRAVRALDIGSGDTWLARSLLSQLPLGSTMDCVDSSFTPDQLKVFTEARLGIRAWNQIPPDTRYDLITLLDVVEHVKDDRKFLSDIVKSQLASGGRIVISVPAYQCLFSSHDVWLEHFRRYSPSAGRRLVSDCGLTLETEGTLFHSLLYPRLITKIVERIKAPKRVAGVAAWSRGPVLTGAIQSVLQLDWQTSELLRGFGITIPGLSWWCVCRKD